MKIYKYLSFTFQRRFLIAPVYKFLSISVFLLILFLAGNGQKLPKGFNQVLVATNIKSPTVMAFAPDGRLFVAEQAGALRIIKNGVLLTQPFITLKVNSRGERGLLGIAFDPAFTTNKYIYLYYTDSSGSNNRISRFTAKGDTVVPKSEVLVLNLSPLSSASNHNGGNMIFGKDGKLYVGVGENAYPPNAQNLDTYLGKILRINKDGSAPSDNPFTTGSAQRRRIWAYGMRNPYTLSVQPVTGRIFVNDVGQDKWEEINDCTEGGNNYGWPLAEGMDTTSAFTNPIYTYGHGEGNGVGCAITGGTFFNPSKTNYPSSYIGKYFFLDYCGSWIDMISLKTNPVTRAAFDSSVPRFPVGMATSPDGNLYFLSRVIGAVYKITYTNSGAPVIDEQPASITVSKGNSASFYVKATGTDTLKYQWRKNGVNINGAAGATYKISSVHYSDSGKYSVTVRNKIGSVTSSNAILKVTAPNHTPIATIKTPEKGATYAAGDKIKFSGSGTDAEDGTLPASAFSWFVLFHHDTHTHPGPNIPPGISSGSFTIPNLGETSSNVFYRLYLVVTDSKGATDTSYTDIIPRKSAITLNTNPAGLRITLDGQPFTAPLTVTSVEGMMRTIGVITPEGKYTFSSWSNGGDTIQTFATPVNDVIYTANFSEAVSDTIIPVADAFVRAGTFANKNYGTDTFLSVKKSPATDYDREVYLKFDIASASSEVSSAILRLYGSLNSTENSSLITNVYNVPDTTWSETAITFNNSPGADTLILAKQNISGAATKYYNWNITQQIKKLRKAGVNLVTLKIVNNDTTLSRADFMSKESGNKPALIINYSSIAARENNRQIISKESFNKEINFSIYPNPATNSFNILFNNTVKNGTVRIYDMNGKLIKILSTNIDKIQQVYTGDLRKGIYMVNIIDGKKSVSKKLIIEK